jgi:hypothetical protein
MDNETWDRIGQAADEDNTTRSAVIRRAVVEHLNKRNAERSKQ